MDPRSPQFQVDIPRKRGDDVEISDLRPNEDGTLVQELRVRLRRVVWDSLAEGVQNQLNLRLRTEGHPLGSWKSGLNIVRRDLGKELTLLCWAVEEADPGTIPLALSNWLGLEPEERWWLYTQTAAATGDALSGRGRGWRVAVRYALTDNPAPGERPRQTRRTPAFYQQAAQQSPGLFDTEQD
ncbi:DUF3780 domain-containing protein (plasmid) [Deinococcus psychrotolerans]|uniref:DUF3780 domain-containing protein n=2 Tax=Deinococcus psychrotolerans TaxID=2489213 RepID=A0A3G8YUI4_9DEIO|nr:DUF3780 domain-containing protein [Deinococcus psychrotolerans]